MPANKSKLPVRLLLQHEYDDEPSYIVAEGDHPDEPEQATAPAGRLPVARELVRRYNIHGSALADVSEAIALIEEDPENNDPAVLNLLNALYLKLKGAR